MDDLVEFLRARYDEEESLAFSAGRHLSGQLDLGWTAAGAYVWPDGVTANEKPVVDTALMEDMPGYEVARARARHIAEHDPDRVLREIDAKRKLLALYVEHERMDRETFEAEGDHARSLVSLRAAYLDAVRHHAAVYADRPGYREEWRP
ncbi:DUF6221 family protein [Streptomyces hygroscopicus]|uniref:DUF6221 family protein n=1 Tax=Streptomyces hygroscopicus TaxID=1912 RepID=UPI0033D4A2B0